MGDDITIDWSQGLSDNSTNAMRKQGFCWKVHLVNVHIAATAFTYSVHIRHL